MTTTTNLTCADSIRHLSNDDLIAATKRAASVERRSTAELIALLAELESRRLFLGQGCASLFTFCTQILGLSEHEAYLRIEVARAARRFPAILELVADGSITLTTVALLRVHLTADNHQALLEVATHKSKREVEQIVARLAPKTDVKPLVRRLPQPIWPVEPASEAVCGDNPRSSADRAGVALALPLRAPAAATPRPVVAALSDRSYLLRVTLSAAAHERLRRAQDLMRHTVPNGDPAEILDRALTLLVDHLEKTKCASRRRPKSVGRPLTSASTSRARASRHIPAAVKREVWKRDGGRCAFKGIEGRCTETGQLEYHHVVPYARDGIADAANIALRCRAHNQYESDEQFGLWADR